MNGYGTRWLVWAARMTDRGPNPVRAAEGGEQIDELCSGYG
jgi:hypothetical protein